MPHTTRRRAQQSTAAAATIGLIGTLTFGGALCITAHTSEDLVLLLVPFLISLCTTACSTMAVVISRNNETLVNSLAASMLLRELADDAEPKRPTLRVVDQT